MLMVTGVPSVTAVAGVNVTVVPGGFPVALNVVVSVKPKNVL